METNQTKPVNQPSEETAFRKKASFAGWATLGYVGIMNAVQIIGVMAAFILMIIISIIGGKSLDLQNLTGQDLTDGLSGLGVILAASVVGGSIFMMLIMKKTVTPKEAFAKKKKMPFTSFISLVLIIFIFQLPNSLLNAGFEKLLNLIGLTLEGAASAVNVDKMGVSMFIYMALFAPFFEDFIFRGYTMTAYHKASGNKLLAIIVSALYFGIMHGNPTQIPFATLVGLVLGYAVIEYGLIWGILLHFINNFGLAGLLSLILKPFSEETSTTIEMIVISILFVFGIVSLILNRKKLAAFLKENRLRTDQLKWSLISIPFILFLILHLGAALFQIQPMK